MARFELRPEQFQIERLFDYSQIEKFIIPEFQRPYSWKRQHCEQLWDDLSNAYEAMRANNQTAEESAYFLGSIIVYPENNNKRALNIIDGQQRITTLILFIRAIYTSLQNIQNHTEFVENSEIRSMQSLSAGLEHLLWEPMDPLDTDSGVDYDIPRLRRDNVENTDNNYFSSIMRKGKLGNDDESCIDWANTINRRYDDYLKKGGKCGICGQELKIIEASECTNYSYFLSKCTEKQFTELKGLISFIRKYCYILLINTDSAESALDTFEILNNRGMQLADADIFKNRLSKTYRNDGKTSFKQDWQTLANTLQTDDESGNTQINLDGIFRHYMYAVRMSSDAENLFLHKSKEPRLRDFYTRNDPLHKKDQGRRLLDSSRFILSLTQMSDFLLGTLGHIFANYSTARVENLVDNRVKYDLTLLNKYQKSGRWHYLISTFWYCYQSLISNRPDTFKEKFSKFIHYSASVLFLKHILTGSMSDADIPFLCEKIALQAAREGLIPTFNSSFGITTQLNSQLVENRQILSGEIIRDRDNLIIDRLDEARTILSGDTSKFNYLVYLYTYAFDSNSELPSSWPNDSNSERQELLTSATIEHILPQKWKSYYGTLWLNDCDNNEGVINDYVEHLGNKLILPRERNIRASDRDFEAKLKAYSETKPSQPTFELTQFIESHKNAKQWTRHDVDERTNQMIDIIIDFIRSGIEGGIA